MRRLVDRIQAAALLAFGAVAFVYFGPMIDKLFPVVEPFVVTSKEVVGQSVFISGWLHKRRDCEFIEATARATRSAGAPAIVTFEFLETRQLYTRQLGPQEWGPWRVVVPLGAEQLEVSALHHCHPLWKTRTDLATIRVGP